jgi:hypothetical protein
MKESCHSDVKCGKAREIMEVMHGLPWRLFPSADLKLSNGVKDGETYRDNALQRSASTMNKQVF